MISGRSFGNFLEWKSMMKQEERQLMRGFVEKLMSYALGRKLYAFDRPDVTDIVDYVEINGSTILAALKGVTLSPQFRNKNVVEDL
jgi:hypothetical protein